MKRYFLVLLLCSVYSVSIFAQEKSGGKISGYMFGDYFYNVARDSAFESLSNTALTGAKDLNGFQFRRIYFTYDYNISDKFSTRLRLESQTAVGVNNTIFTTFIKDAYLRWKDVFDGSSLIFGIQPTPTFSVSEEFWGYRSLERTITDLRRVASSRDFGITLKGKLISSGKVNYWLMFANGNAFESDNDKYKRAYAHLEFSPDDNFSVTAYADYRFKPKKNYSQFNESFNNDALLSALFLGYKQKNEFSLGLESFLQLNNNDLSQNTGTETLIKDRSAIGISAFGSYNFSGTLAGVVRYDYFDYNISGDYKGDSRNFFLIGLDVKLHEKVSIIPNIEYETYETPVNEVAIDPSLTARITFYYEFL